MSYDINEVIDLAWTQLWQVTVVAFIVALVVRLCGRVRPHLAYLLWMLVILKCLTPPLWSSPTGLFSWMQIQTNEVALASPPPTLDRAASTKGTYEPDKVASALTLDSPPQVEVITPGREQLNATQQLPQADPRRNSASVPAPSVPPAQAARPTLSWTASLAMLWICGVVVSTFVVMTKQFLCTLMVWHHGLLANAELQDLLESLSRHLGVRRRVRLLLSKGPLGPAAYGLVRPTILLPEMLTRGRHARQMEPILAHELIHFRRGDTFIATLQLATQIVWWFHPLIWWANRELTRERERCCDEEAVAGLRCDPGDYAQTLLDVLRSKRQLKPLFGQPGVRSVDITARRLEHIMQPNYVPSARTPRHCWFIAGLMAALLLPGGGLVFNLAATGTAEERNGMEVSRATRDWPQYGGGPQRNNVSNETNLPTTWNLETGENVKWTAKLGTAVYSSPVMAHGKVLIGTNNGASYGERFPLGSDASCLVCFDADTGAFLWQHANEKLATGRVHDWPQIGICSTSLIEEDRVWYVNNRNEVVCLDLDGFYDNTNDGLVQDEPTAALGEADVIWRLDLMSSLGVSQHNQAICSITAVDDLLLVGTSHGLDESHLNQPDPAPSFIAVHKKTGKVVWRDASPTGNLLHGQWSSPAYGVIGGVGQALFAGGDGWLYSFDVNAIKQGKSELLWKFDCNPKTSEWILGGRGTRNNTIAIPVIHDDKVFMVVGQDPEHGEGKGRAWCIDATQRGDISAELVFRKDDPSTPVPHQRTQAANIEEGDIVRPNPNSGVVWHYHETDRDGDGKIAFDESMHRSFSSVVVHDGLAIVPDYSGIVHCLDAKTGAPQWTYDMLATIWGTPLVADGRIYIGDEDGDVAVFELSRELRLLAEVNVGNSVYTTIMAAHGTLYIPSQGTLFALQTPTSRSKEASAFSRSNWPSHRGDAANTAVSRDILPSKIGSLWTYRTGAEFGSSPVVSGSVAYIGDLVDSLYAINVDTGKAKWVLKSDSGFAASPLLADETLIIGDLNGRVRWIDAHSGRVLRSFDIGEPIVASAKVADGLTIVPTEGGTVFAFDTKTSKLIWKSKIASQLQSAATVDGERLVFAGCDQKLLVLDPATGETRQSLEINSPTGATPAIHEGCAYVGTEDGELFCIELATGKQRWRFKHPSISSGIRRAVAVANDTVVFASRGKALLGVNTGTGKIRWQFSAKSKFDSSPVIVDCHAVIGATDGRLYVIDIATGQERFVYELGDSIVGSVVPTSRRLIVATANGQVQCLGDTSRPTRELAATTNDKVNSTIIDDRNFGEIQIESAGAEQLQVRSQMQGNTPEILIEGRSRLIITARGLTHIGEADALVVRGWKPGATDWSKAVFLFKGNVIWKTAGDRFMPREGVSEIHADSMRYEAATMRGSLIGVGNNAWIIRSNGSKQRIATQPAPEPIWRSTD